MKTYKYKCQICKTQIDTDFLEIEHITKSKNIVKKRFHKQCYEAQLKKQQAKDAFYEYIKTNFFQVVIPTVFFANMVEIKCDYTDILDCCESIDLVKIINQKTFKTDYAKTRYIIAVIKANINKYIERKSLDIDTSNFAQNGTKNEFKFLDRSRYLYKHSTDFNA